MGIESYYYHSKLFNSLNIPLTWEDLFPNKTGVLLESAQGGQYTLVAPKVAQWIAGGNAGDRLGGDSPESIWQKWMNPRLSQSRYAGGLVSLVSYDWGKEYWLRNRKNFLPKDNDLDLPKIVWALILEGFVWNKKKKELLVFQWHSDSDPKRFSKHAEKQKILWQKACKKPQRNFPKKLSENLVSKNVFPKQDFTQAVKKIHQWIAKGHTYQVNLSMRQQTDYTGCPWLLYECLRQINPSPYMGVFSSPDFTLISGSPELLGKMDNHRIISRPIAGTRKIGKSAEEQVSLQKDLFSSEKEKAEHLMLVDLVRNDLGRVCSLGSVRVSEFMRREQYSHVQHIVSQVEGTRSKENSIRDVFLALFPGGTITGAPKIRTMEIIEALEPVSRNFYTGSLGWIGFNGEAEWNILIRSILVHEKIAYWQTGAGIVIDSDPELEYQECLDKAQAQRIALTCLKK